MPTLEEVSQKIKILEKRVFILEKQQHQSQENIKGKKSFRNIIFGFLLSALAIFLSDFFSYLSRDLGGFIGFFGKFGMILCGIAFVVHLFGKKSEEEVFCKEEPKSSSEEFQEEERAVFGKKSFEEFQEKERKAAFEAKSFFTEEFFGKNLFTKIGVGLSAIGVALFVKYSFDNGWIGAMGRVSLGMLAGIAFVFLGDILSKKYKKYALTIMGGGFSMMYFSVFAARNFYEAEIGLPSGMAFFLLIFITIAAAFLAHRHNEESFALFAIGGGFATPFLINRGDNISEILCYIILLDLATLFLAAHHKWEKLSFGAFIASFLLSSGTFLEVDPPLLGSLFLALFFFLFLGFSLVNILGKKENFSPLVFSFSLLAPIFYFGQMIAFFEEYNLSAYQGLFTLGLATLYVIIGSLSFQKKSDQRIIESFFGAALAFIAVAIFFEANVVWTPILWATEGAILFFLGQKNKWEIWKIGAVLMGISLIWYFGQIFSDHFLTSFFNQRIGVGAFLIAIFGFLQWRFEKNPLSTILQYLIFLMPIVMGWREISEFFISSETQEFFYRVNQSTQMKIGLGHSIFLALYALLFFVIGSVRNAQIYRIAAMGVFLFAILKVLAYDLWELGEFYRIVSVLSLGGILLGVGFLYHRNQAFFFPKK